MRALGARSVTVATLVAGTLAMMWWLERFRADYWAQLSPWVTFLAGGFAVLAGTLVFAYWRLAERSTYYLRFGEKLPFGEETALLARRGPTLIVGHAGYVDVLDFPPRVMHAMYVGFFLGLALISLDNRAVALLRDAPARFSASRIDYCKPPEPPRPAAPPSQGCRLVERAFKLGYAKNLGSCAPKVEQLEAQPVCTRRQLDEPYFHYAWRRLADRVDELRTVDAGPGSLDRFETQLDHLGAIVATTLDTVAMHPRASHHIFTNLPDPRPRLRDRVDRMLERGCAARVAHLQHFPRIDDPSLLFEQVLAQLMFNPRYKPVIAQCEEVIVHWDAPADACTKIAADPAGALGALGALDAARGVLALRAERLELQQLGRRARDIPPAARVVSFQCLMFDQPAPVVEHPVTLDGEPLAVRAAHMAPLVADGASQIRLYKQLAALLAPGFGYGRLTSNQAVSAAPEEAATAAMFKDPAFLLTKLDLLRDADLFLGNDWLVRRPDLLEVYPYHLHLQNFIQIFRRQYQEHEGRL